LKTMADSSEQQVKLIRVQHLIFSFPALLLNRLEFF
jgi:hypothetical protein